MYVSPSDHDEEDFDCHVEDTLLTISIASDKVKSLIQFLSQASRDLIGANDKEQNFLLRVFVRDNNAQFTAIDSIGSVMLQLNELNIEILKLSDDLEGDFVEYAANMSQFCQAISLGSESDDEFPILLSVTNDSFLEISVGSDITHQIYEFDPSNIQLFESGEFNDKMRMMLNEQIKWTFRLDKLMMDHLNKLMKIFSDKNCRFSFGKENSNQVQFNWEQYDVNRTELITGRKINLDVKTDVCSHYGSDLVYDCLAIRKFLSMIKASDSLIFHVDNEGELSLEANSDNLRIIGKFKIKEFN